jgi:hypothetical protein
MVAQSNGINPVGFALWNTLIARTNSPDARVEFYAANSSNSAFASFRSRVSNPSVNHP